MLRRPRHTRRPTSLPILLVVLVLSGTLAACGEDGEGQDSADRLDAVKISGEVGSAPAVEWTSLMKAGKPEIETLTEGDGAAVEKDDTALINFWVGNGYTQKVAFDTFGPESPGARITLGTPSEQLESVEDIIAQYLATQIEPGTTRGSRLALTVAATDLFGQNITAEPVAQADIGKDDSLLVVVDLADVEPLPRIRGIIEPSPPWAPKVVAGGGKVTNLDFDGTPALGNKLKVFTQVQGDGDEVEKGDLLVANYLGVVYRGTKPFDESFTKPTSLARGIGVGAVVKGWDQGLVGQKVGSRVLLGIPPDLGYGAQGSPPTIPANATLYFVIDILATV